MIRLDKYICDAGIASRSTAKKLIKDGHVTVNGAVCNQPDAKIAEGDVVCYDHAPIRPEGMIYYLFYKPTGCICANTDPSHQTVFDYVPQSVHRDLFTVGRLDKDTTGVLIITNDGELSHKLLSPAHHVDKTYEVTTDEPLSDKLIELFADGIEIGEKRPTQPATLTIDPADAHHSFCTISEGMYHQIKRMYGAYGYEVVGLHRLRMGAFQLDEGLAPGQYRPFTEAELQIVADIKAK